MRHTLSLTGALWLCLALASCDDGGGSSCKDMHYQSTQIRIVWTLNGVRSSSQGEASFDTCLDYQASKAQLRITGPKAFLLEDAVTCTSHEVTLSDDSCERFAPGTYNVELVFLDSADQALSRTVTASGVVQQSMANPPIVLDVPREHFLQHDSFTGTYLFNPIYGGRSCADASGIASLEASFYDGEDPLEDVGTVTSGCHDQVYVNEVPAGDLTLQLVARNEENEPLYCGTFDVKVGVGVTNPVFDHHLTADACAGVE